MDSKTEMPSIEMLDKDSLKKAYDGSFYTICGVGGDLREWVLGLGEALVDRKIGRPKGWYETTGAAVNRYVLRTNGWSDLTASSAFPDDLTILMFSLEGLDLGKLAIFRLVQQDRWFDDIVQNMQGM